MSDPITDDELTPWELMRAIDAYAYDYKEHGKLSESRRYVEKQLAYLIEAQRAAVLEEAARVVDAACDGTLRSSTAAAIRSLPGAKVRSLIDKEADHG